MGFAYYVMLKNYSLLAETGFIYGLVIVLTFTAGASFLMWMGEQIDEFGIGNGISMILFAGIISRIPTLISNMVTMLGEWHAEVVRCDPDRCRHAGADGLHRVHHEFRAPHPRAVRQARCRPQDVRWSVDQPAHQGQHVRRSAHHLRPVHRLPARYDRGLHRHERLGFWSLDEQVRLRHEERRVYRCAISC